MTSEFKPGVLDNVLCALSPERGLKRLAARRILHQFRYDGAIADSRRASAPQNMSPNSFDVQRDRLQLMREAEDMERNFAPAKMLNRKFASYVTPRSYHAQTGDTGLDRDIEEYLMEDAFLNCDVTGRYDFFHMLEFGVMGCNRGGDYGWAFQRLGAHPDMSEDELVQLPFRIQAIEPDRIGGIYQNVVSNDYVSGLNIGEYGQIESFRVFHRSMTTNTYDNPIDVPARDFVHLTDPMRIDQYRGVSILATAIQNLRDLYEMIDYVKGKAKLASALTVFTNSNGAMAGNGAMDAYSTNLFPGDASGLQQDIQFGQINHLAAGTDIKFPASSSPSSEEQWLMTQLLKFVAMSYDLPYSFALDASALGGVSSRLESEMAKATFERFQGVLAPHANRMKNAMLYDAVAKGIFPVSKLRVIHKGRWGYRPHPQPDLGKEASAAVSLYQHGMLDPMQHWVDNGQDPETVAESMTRWAQIKKAASEKSGISVTDIFGSGPTTPTATSESTTESVAIEKPKEFSTRKEFREADSSINARIEKERENVDFGADWVADIKEGIADLASGENPEALQRLRVELDKANAYLAEHKAALDKLEERRERRDKDKPAKPAAGKESKEIRAKKRDDRHALTEALKASGKPEQEAYAIAYNIIESGKFDKSKLPSDIQKKYYS
jgi:capsid protein